MFTRLVRCTCVAALCAVVIGCSGLLPLRKATLGEFEVIDLDSDLNTPAWINDNTLISTAGQADYLFRYSAVSGSIAEHYTIDLESISHLNDVDVSPDATAICFAVFYEAADGNDEEYSDICVYDLDTGELTNLTDGSGSFHGASFLSNSSVVYVEYEELPDGDLTNRVLRHDLSTDETETLYTITFDPDEGNPVGGNVWWGKASPAHELFFCHTHGEDGSISFKVLDTETGETVFDGVGVREYEDIKGGDFVDQNTVVISAGTQGSFRFALIDIRDGSVVDQFPIADDRVDAMWGVNLSPDGSVVASSAQDLDADGEHLTNRLIVCRIANAPE